MSGRDFAKAAYARKGAKRAALTPEQRKAAAKLAAAKPVLTAPVVGDPEAIDWDTCVCPYVHRCVDGKALPKTREPAWSQWTEEPNTTGRSDLRSHVRNLALRVYRLGYRHGNVALYDDGGFPDDLYWGPAGPGLIFRELKAMRADWKRGQKQHLLSLRQAGQDVGVWRPCCWLSGRIDAEMAALAGRAPVGRPAGAQPHSWKDFLKELDRESD